MQESGEMYLETILILGKRKNVVRSIDIAEEMEYSKASVSRAVSKLKQDGYILVDGDGHIALTEKGYQLAGEIYERHVVLTKILTDLGVSEESFEAIKKHIREKKGS